MIKINGDEIAAYPSSFQVTILDLDDGDSSVRATNGTLSRDRIAVKRQIDMSWGVLTDSQISRVLKAMSAVFFELYYPDPQEGQHVTKTMYVGNRPAPFAVEQPNGAILWNGLKVTLTEQ
ncbi:hypothetical protein KIH86_13840 [Paenibacillus sp. HN-1]|uniref:DUF6711 family protein n=1 Tax=Paenibacillus TaxID=44249 RepID=UPI000FB5688A|nr:MULTISPECIES: DUF6711 family protein [Paenibacillus]MBY9082387.1 hypothetical protein [Paenibacillus sp. CGMCC 1.18879]MBY9085309.1 hypothetical protein [Paenibacillus sinensis]